MVSMHALQVKRRSIFIDPDNASTEYPHQHGEEAQVTLGGHQARPDTRSAFGVTLEVLVLQYTEPIPYVEMDWTHDMVPFQKRTGKTLWQELGAGNVCTLVSPIAETSKERD